jgi:hypothetical protein
MMQPQPFANPAAMYAQTFQQQALQQQQLPLLQQQLQLPNPMSQLQLPGIGNASQQSQLGNVLQQLLQGGQISLQDQSGGALERN